MYPFILEYNFKITYNKTKSYTIEISDQERYEIDGYLIAEENGKTSLITNFADETSKCKIFIQDNIFIHVFTQVHVQYFIFQTLFKTKTFFD